jgi:hypothetical protein
MNGGGKSDGLVVPAKPPNNAGGAPSAAEEVEGRSPAKGNSVEAPRHRTPRRIEPSLARRRIRREASHRLPRVTTRGKSPVR